jgi:hypothetical protein
VIFHSWLAVSGYFSREVLDAPGAAALTQDVTVQGVTASPLTLRRQEQTTLLEGTENTHTQGQCRNTGLGSTDWAVNF